MFCFDKVEHFFPYDDTIIENFLGFGFLFILWLFVALVANRIFIVKGRLGWVFVITKEEFHHFC